VFSAAIPQRADMVFKRCTNAVETPFGVTGALAKLAKFADFIFGNCLG